MSKSIFKNSLKLFITALVVIGFSVKGFCQSNPLCTIEIKNPSAIFRDHELVSFPYEKLLAKLSGSKAFKLIELQTETEIPFQLEYKGKKQPVNVLMQISCAPGARILVAVVSGNPAVVAPKTFARFVPERFDDFAWENDRVAFRMYGQALESRKDNAYGIDVWSKRTSDLIINKWYKSGDYHIDHGEGLDCYGVGLTLGAGDIAPYINDSIYFTNNFKSWKILDNGPLRSTFQLTYAIKNVANIPVAVTKTISLDAGSQLNRVEVTFNYSGNSELPVVIGIVKRNGKGKILFDEQQSIMGYWEPENPANGTTGVGCVFTQPVKGMTIAKGHILSSAKIHSQQPYVYYTGVAWNKANKITSSEKWFTYLSDFSNTVKHPLEINIR